MWTPLSVSQRVRLLTLVVVMLSAATPAESNIELICCLNGTMKMPNVDILSCYEQKPRERCRHHAYVIVSDGGMIFCVEPKSPKLQRQLRTGKLTCPPEIMKIHSKVDYKFMAEDDVVE